MLFLEQMSPPAVRDSVGSAHYSSGHQVLTHAKLGCPASCAIKERCASTLKSNVPAWWTPWALPPMNEKKCAVMRDFRFNRKPHICYCSISIAFPNCFLNRSRLCCDDSFSVHHSNSAGFFRGDAHKMGLGWLVPGSLAKSMCFVGEPNCLFRCATGITTATAASFPAMYPAWEN